MASSAEFLVGLSDPSYSGSKRAQQTYAMLQLQLHCRADVIGVVSALINYIENSLKNKIKVKGKCFKWSSILNMHYSQMSL